MSKTELQLISDHLLNVIDSFVAQNGYINDLPQYESEMNLKIDLLERTLEILRIENKCLENILPMEKFIQGKIFVEKDCLRYVASEKYEGMGSGTSPLRLQPKLLLFLLAHHQNRLNVYDMIDNFIKRIWDYLGPLDFKKTRTGVIRCFTNTRFAAHTLRDYGLLKFTKDEAYKTWTLSLPGYLVAAKVMADGKWAIPDVEKKMYFNLHPDILDVFNDLKDYGVFVQRLTAICKPNTKVFENFKDTLQIVHSSLDSYWQVINDVSIAQDRRSKKSLKLLKQIEDDQNVKQFYKEFSKCLEIGNILNLREW